MLPSGFAVRITHPASIAQRIIRAWSTYAKKIVLYEHNDDGANNLHCHAHVEGFNVTIKRFQQLAQESGVPLTYKKEGKTRATSLLSFRGADYDHHPSGYAYLTKGKYEPSYLQGFTKEETDQWKATWVQPQKHVKRTTWHKLYEKFESEMGKDIKPPPRKYNEYGELIEQSIIPIFEVLETAVKKFVWNLSGGIWTPQMYNQIQCLIRTHAYKHKITIPQDWKGK